MRGKILLVLALLVGFGSSAFAQGVIRGKVTDKKTGESLAGVRVSLTSKEDDRAAGGGITNKDGDFQIQNLKAGKYGIKASYVGYKAGESIVSVDAGATVTANYQLVLDVRGLDEVVVTGIASRTSRGVSEVAVGRVNASEIGERTTFTNAAQLLNGKVSGVTISQASGTVGGGLRFNVRSGAGLLGGAGGANPLIFVDGVLIFAQNVTGIGVGGQQSSALSDLNPSDIENIEVLKGPSASALYGPQAQNGVILITTKRGKGQGTNEISVNYQGTFGFSEPHRLFREGEIESWREANASYRRGQLSQHSLNLQGSSGIFNYFLGYENRSEEGIVLQNKLDRQTVRFNLDAVTSQNLTLKASASYSRNINDRPQNDNNTRGWLGNTLLYSPWTSPQGGAGATGLAVQNRAYRTPDTEPARGRFGTYVFLDSADIAAIENTLATDRFIGSGEVVYTVPFVPGLRLRGLAGFDLQNVRNINFFPAGRNYGGTIGRTGYREIFTFQNTRTNFDLQATYDWSVEKIVRGTTILGSQLINTVQNNSDLSALNFPTSLIRDVSAGEASTRTVSEFFSNTRTAGVIGRQELRFFEDLFSLSGGVRIDWSTAYGIDAPVNTYPQAGGMLRLDKMGFLPEVINQAKIRLAYGQSGRLPGQLDGQRFLWQAGQSPVGAGAILNNAGNTGIRPERVIEYEAGVDLEFDNAYGAEFTYYITNTTEGLVNAPRVPSSGLGNSPLNLGRVDGWGFESLLYARPIQTKETSLEVNLIINYADNIVRDIGFSAGGQEFFRGNNQANYIIPGQRRWQFIGLKPTTPRYLANGYYNWANGSGMRNGIEIDTVGALRSSNGIVLGKPIGSAIPIFTGSFSVNFRFLNDFTFHALAEYALGGYTFNYTRAFYTNPTYSNSPAFNRLATQLGLFGSQVNATNGAAAQERGPAAQLITGRIPGVPVLTPNTPEYAAAAAEFMKFDYSTAPLTVGNYVESSNWLRIREISLRWNAANTVNALFGSTLRTLSLGASVTNLALFTNYTGPEVEINGGITSDFTAGYDFLTLMQTRSYNFMISIGL